MVSETGEISKSGSRGLLAFFVSWYDIILARLRLSRCSKKGNTFPPSHLIWWQSSYILVKMPFLFDFSTLKIWLDCWCFAELHSFISFIVDIVSFFFTSECRILLIGSLLLVACKFLWLAWCLFMYLSLLSCLVSIQARVFAFEKYQYISRDVC